MKREKLNGVNKTHVKRRKQRKNKCLSFFRMAVQISSLVASMLAMRRH